MIQAGQLRSGNHFELEGVVHMVVDYNHNKTGRGGAVIKVKVKNMDTGSITNKLFRPGDKFPSARIEARPYQFLYNSQNTYTFMDLESYEQVDVDVSVIGDDVKYITENLELELMFHKENIRGVQLPNFLIYEITTTDPGLKGDTVSNVTKPATVSAGFEVQVPLFVNEGDKVKVDTRTGHYMERA
jgi:elongation factor P